MAPIVKMPRPIFGNAILGYDERISWENPMISGIGIKVNAASPSVNCGQYGNEAGIKSPGTINNTGNSHSRFVLKTVA